MGALRDAVDAAPWLMGPALWALTMLGAGALLHGLPDRDYSLASLGLGAVAGAAADALVVLGGHPWPGLVAGIAAFALVVAVLVRGRAHSGAPDAGRLRAARRAERGG